MSLPNLLFITPVLPSPVGSGTMLRSGMVLEALSKRFAVHVLNFNLWTTNFGKLSLVHKRAASYAEVPGRSDDIDAGALINTFFPGVPFAAIHTYRLAMARVAVGILGRIGGAQPFPVLDLDDDECALSTRVLNLLEQGDDPEAAKRLREEQPQLRIMEKVLAPRFHSICLANLGDCRALAARYPRASVHHLPNAVRLPEIPSAETASRERKGAATILFVGALNYPPNWDGICFFVERVLPLIQERAGFPVSFCVVGSDPPERAAMLARNPAVTIHGNVPNVAPFYRDADVCVVPLRAGSGTRIKILEAFSLRRPVVSTRLGAEGLRVTGGEQLLFADEPEDMAQACLTMLNDSAERRRMVDSAHAWVEENHSLAAIETAIDSIYAPVLERTS